VLVDIFSGWLIFIRAVVGVILCTALKR